MSAAAQTVRQTGDDKLIILFSGNNNFILTLCDIWGQKYSEVGVTVAIIIYNVFSIQAEDKYQAQVLQWKSLFTGSVCQGRNPTYHQISSHPSLTCDISLTYLYRTSYDSVTS